MRIALITIPGLYGAYFARETQAHFANAEFMVFCQVPATTALRAPNASAVTDSASASVADGAAHRAPRVKALLRKVYWKGYELSHLRIDPFEARSLWNRPNVVRTTDINDSANVARLHAFRPDYILIFGGRIVRPSVLETARRVALNVHGGKLPEYRGANGVKWMLWNGDVDRVCATVHVAAPKVDAGEVIREARIEILPDDRYRTIFTRLHASGVRAMIDAVTDIERGTAEFRPQTGTARTYRAAEWSPRQEAMLDRRLALSLRKPGLGSFSRKIVFHAYRRLQRFVPPSFSPTPRGSVALLYHHVASQEDRHVSRLGITITPEHFEEHVRYLTSHFEVVPFSALAARSGDPRVVALTFDDGFRSVATTALPILARYGCPMKLYLCESLVDGGLSWLNKLSVLLNELRGGDLETFLIAALNRPLTAPRREPIIECIEYFDPQRTIAVVDDYYARMGVTPPARLYLGEIEIQRLVDHPLVEVGSHTRFHLPQHALGREQRHDEIVLAHHDLVSRFGERIRGFALPFGYRTHFTPDVVADIRKVDDAVVSAYGGYADPSRIHGEPEVRRIGVWGNLGTLWHQIARGG
jgi:folate-dependent phosphoribosylglycinamide formyltransferase PurN/peptidoglycan/xylan/chitin deacetylase (PgdA/CDA1 family)